MSSEKEFIVFGAPSIGEEEIKEVFVKEVEKLSFKVAKSPELYADEVKKYLVIYKELF